MLIINILASCTQSDGIQDLAEETFTEEVKIDNLLKLSSIEDLENISLDRIPGGDNYKKWRLESLTYDCVDTIEHRALLLDVKATIVSNKDRRIILTFSTEVGPELVSVEYYPKVEVIAAHHNMLHGVYPRVERYRNYSDGSRIGPDIFYDYGHPVQSFSTRYGFIPASVSSDESLWNEGPEDWVQVQVLNPEKYFVENGKYCQYKKIEIGYFNSNASAYNWSGDLFNGDDLFPSEYKSISFDHPTSIDYNILKDNFYGVDKEGDIHYMLSRGFDLDDDTTKLALNICKDIPIAQGAPQFSKDTHNLDPGFYFCNAESFNKIRYGFTSKYCSSIDKFEIADSMFPWITFYLQYMIIDGRLIHFNDICNFNCVGERHEVTKAENYVRLRLESEWRMYGEIFMSRGDLYLYKKNGPEEIVKDDRDTNGLDSKDQLELDNVKTRANIGATESGFKDNGKISRSDGKTVEIDNRLPSSIKTLPIKRTIKKI